jgi:hypothetical protein
MLQRVLVLGLLGPLALAGTACAGWPPGDSPPADASATAPRPAPAAERTKQVTLAVRGMT